MPISGTKRNTLSQLRVLGLAFVLLASACGSSDDEASTSDTDATSTTASDTGATDTDETGTDDAETGDGESEADWYEGEYVISDDIFGAETVVTLTEDSRIIETNSLPPWDAGEFPEGNNTELTEVDATYTIPLEPVFTGAQSRSIVFGVSIAGIKFDAGTAQQAQCENGVSYNIEAVQSLIPFGLDQYGAHVQNDGTYHYHYIPVAELEGEDPEFVGWALDGYAIYYSPSDEYASSYQLRTEDREGTGCTYSEPDLEEIAFDATPDGTFTQDWEFVEGSGQLDECNGVELDGEYVYFITEDFPIVPRCLNGEAETVGGGGGGGVGEQGGPPPEGGGPDGAGAEDADS